MNAFRNKQKGMATLLIAVALIVSITLVSLYTGKVVLNQTKLEADSYRSSQALAAANAALDYGVSYHMNGGLDHNTDSVVDHGSVASGATSTIVYTGQTTSYLMYYDNDDSDNATGEALCSSTATTDSGIVYGVGWSDDQTATRTLSQCLGVIPLFTEEGPEQPLISKGAVGTTGASSIINRYHNTNVWAGDSFDIGNSSAMNTYICNTGSCTSSLTDSQLMDTDPTNNAQKISSSNLGNGYDVIDSDQSLSNLTGDQFYNNFFALSRTGMETVAQNLSQHYAGGTGTNHTNVSSTINGQSSIIWIDGNATINSNVTIGSVTSPAIVYINGNLNISGGPTIYGILYVVGQMDVSGGVSVIGSSIVEGDSTMVPSGEDPVEGTGTLNLVFAPSLFDTLEDDPNGLSNVVDGSWRDW